jgi:hypothetical protein
MLPYRESDFKIKYLGIGDWGPTLDNHKSATSSSWSSEEKARGRDAQQNIANEMKNWATREQPIDFVLSHGDHFYWSGISAATNGDHDRWKTQFENMYDGDALYVPWYGVMGNHDYGGASGICGANCWNCGSLCETKEDLIQALNDRFQGPNNYISPHNNRWRMDDHYYKVTHSYTDPSGDTSKDFDVDIFNLDTNAAGNRLPQICCQCYASDSNARSNGYAGCTNPLSNRDETCVNGDTVLYEACADKLREWWDDSMAGLARDLPASTATWKIVQQHYMMKFFTPSQQSQLLTILKDGGAHILFGAHEHSEGHGSRCSSDLCSHSDGIHYVENGGGGGKSITGGTGNIWSQRSWGFLAGKISKNYFQLKFIDDQGQPLHCYNIPNDRADSRLPEPNDPQNHPYYCDQMVEAPPTPASPTAPTTVRPTLAPTAAPPTSSALCQQSGNFLLSGAPQGYITHVLHFTNGFTGIPTVTAYVQRSKWESCSNYPNWNDGVCVDAFSVVVDSITSQGAMLRVSRSDHPGGQWGAELDIAWIATCSSPTPPTPPQPTNPPTPAHTGPAQFCDRLYDNYYGYPDCKTSLQSLGSFSCDNQKGLSASSVCPDPNWEDRSTDDYRTINPDGSSSILVYRALRLYDDQNQLDFYGTKLFNSNAASLGGVLGYIAAEVIPEDMRGSEDRDKCQRKWGIDAIMVFNVTVKLPIAGKFMGKFSAYDRGQCTASSDPGGPCDFAGMGGFFPGIQSYNDPRNGFIGHWYSFPGCGFCAQQPTGEPDCTYTYEVLGHKMIDDLVFPHSSNSGGFSDYHSFCTTSNFPEFQRTSETRPKSGSSCKYPGSAYELNTGANFQGLDFWSHVCDERSAQYKQQLLDKLVLDTQFAGTGVAITPNDCGPPTPPTLSPTPPPTAPTVPSYYTQQVATSCNNKYTKYDELQTAQQFCDDDTTCAGVYDGSCDNVPDFKLCRLGSTDSETWRSSGSSCVYKKNNLVPALAEISTADNLRNNKKRKATSRRNYRNQAIIPM